MGRREWDGYRPVRVLGRYRYRCHSCGEWIEVEFDRETEVRVDRTATEGRCRRLVEMEIAERPQPVAPCPSCGRLTPKEAAKNRQWWDQWLGIFGPMLLLGLVAWTYGQATGIAYWLAAPLLPVLTLVALCWFWRTSRAYPVEPLLGKAAPDGEVRLKTVWRPGRGLASALTGLAVLAFLVHPLLRLVTAPVFNQRCEPALVVPGETVRIYVGDDLRSLNGDWSGKPELTLLNEAEFHPHSG